MKIYVEGHRGYCDKYPENTILSFEKAIELGVDAVEFDVWLTSDKQPVLMHDGKCASQGEINAVLTQDNLQKVYDMDVHAWMHEMLEQWNRS